MPTWEPSSSAAPGLPRLPRRPGEYFLLRFFQAGPSPAGSHAEARKSRGSRTGAPDPEWLRRFSRSLIGDRLCASAHNFAPVQSIYRWRGEIYERTEGRVSMHTRRSRVPEIVERAKREHPYEVPGVSTRPITDGNPEYLAWIAAQTEAST
jgi:periplasmic divalent cation tolerance protein